MNIGKVGESEHATVLKEMMEAVPPQKTHSSWVARLRNRTFHLWFLMRRPMTLGVRAIVLDSSRKQILLVRHTYVPGWHIPGGGVDPGETVEQALVRELAEEANIEVLAKPQTVSIHWNRAASRRDHIVLYRIDDYRQTAPKKPDREIADARFFALNNLPDDLSAGTKRRLDEVLGGKEPNGFW